MNAIKTWLPGSLLLALLAALWAWSGWRAPAPWTDAEFALLRSLRLDAQLTPPPDPSNAAADSALAAEFGQHLFFDQRLSGSGQFSCSSCHRPELRFTDGLQQARAAGKTLRHSPSIVGSAFSPWQYWDGRKDSQWAQALAPLEDPQEQDGNRMRLVRVLHGEPLYRQYYETLFGELPDFSDPARFPADAGPIEAKPALQQAWMSMQEGDRREVNTVFARMGKVLAAYERRLLPAPARFDDYVAALEASNLPLAQVLLDPDEQRGLRLFIGKARCIECHNGPLFTNHEFHNTGLLPLAGELPDQGRRRAIAMLEQDEFSCTGPYSDAAPAACTELRYMRRGIELLGALRTPSLRNIHGTAPYMHQGQLATLRAVLQHYNNAAPAVIGHNEAEPLGLNRRELAQLEAFLLTLQAPIAAAPDLLQPLPR
jgi:cytochrome c peroxidase